MDILTLLRTNTISVIATLVTVFAVCFYTYLNRVAKSYEARERAQFPRLVHDPRGLDFEAPNLLTDTKPTKLISLIAPAYNEEKRISKFLDETIESCEREFPNNQYELLIIDDGSKDKTSEVVKPYVKKHGSDKIRLISMPQNRGKGFVVKQGMLSGRGQYLLMLDSDAATDIRDLRRLMERMRAIEKDGLGVAVGSRSHLQQQAVAKRKWYRNILMYGFHLLVNFLGVPGIQDTQCGFKLFTRRAARCLFPLQHIERWCFDVEILDMAQRMNIPIAEVPVNWEEVPGSKLNLVEDSIQMFRDMFLIRLFHTTGIWKTDSDELRQPFTPYASASPSKSTKNVEEDKASSSSSSSGNENATAKRSTRKRIAKDQ